MKIIKDNSNFIDFFSMQDGEQFIYQPNDNLEFLAIKVAGNAILINAKNKFIVAKCYKNTLSIGGGIVRQFDDLDSALEGMDREIANL